MTQALFGHFFSRYTLLFAAFTVLSLAVGVANAATLPQSGDSYSFVRGGGG